MPASNEPGDPITIADSMVVYKYRLLSTLVKHAGKVLTHRQPLVEVWGPSAEFENQYVRVYMNQLRHKLQAEPARPKYLVTVTGVGYRLKI